MPDNDVMALDSSNGLIDIPVHTSILLLLCVTLWKNQISQAIRQNVDLHKSVKP